MKFTDRLNEDEKQRLNKIESPKKKNKNKGHLTRRDCEDIMGMNRDTYTRRNGAVMDLNKITLNISYRILSDFNGVTTVAFYVGDSLCHIVAGESYYMLRKLDEMVEL